MDVDVRISLDSLKVKETERIEKELSPEFLEIDEMELTIDRSIHVKGMIYLTPSHLIMQVSAKTSGSMPCLICNEMTRFTLKIETFTHTERLSRLSRGYFDIRPALREALLLQLPQFVECSNSKCPKRDELKSYLHKESKTEKIDEGIKYFPFKELTL